MYMYIISMCMLGSIFCDYILNTNTYLLTGLDVSIQTVSLHEIKILHNLY
jgi:hypothetical protein